MIGNIRLVYVFIMKKFYENLYVFFNEIVLMRFLVIFLKLRIINIFCLLILIVIDYCYKI